MYLSSTSPASRSWRSRLRSLLGSLSLSRSLPLSSLHTNQELPTSPDIPMCVGRSHNTSAAGRTTCCKPAAQ